MKRKLWPYYWVKIYVLQVLNFGYKYPFEIVRDYHKDWEGKIIILNIKVQNEEQEWAVEQRWVHLRPVGLNLLKIHS